MTPAQRPSTLWAPGGLTVAHGTEFVDNRLLGWAAQEGALRIASDVFVDVCLIGTSIAVVHDLPQLRFRCDFYIESVYAQEREKRLGDLLSMALPAPRRVLYALKIKSNPACSPSRFVFRR